MAQSVRVEFITLGSGGKASPENVIRGVKTVPVSETLVVSNTATVASDRPQAPSNADYGQAVRLTAIENPVFVTWGDDPTATLTNSVRLAVEVPEIVYVDDGDLLSFIAENA